MSHRTSPLSRRDFLASAASIAAAAPLALPSLAHASAFLAQPAKDDSTKPAQPTGGEPFLEWQTLKEGFVAGLGAGGNSLVIFNKEHATLVDTKFSWIGAHLRREARSYARRVTQVINTHHHGDHTGGNHAFSADTPVLAHENAKPRILAQTQQYVAGVPNGRRELAGKQGQAPSMILGDIAQFEKDAANIKPEAWAPSLTVTDGHELNVGSIRVVLRHFGAGHTDNDLVVHCPDHNLLHTGDLLFHKVYPFVDRSAKANTKGWINSLNQIIRLANDDTVIVPGHGAITNKAALAEQIKYFEDMLLFVREQIKAGKPREEVIKMNPAPYDTYNVEWIRPITLGGLYDEVKAEG